MEIPFGHRAKILKKIKEFKIYINQQQNHDEQSGNTHGDKPANTQSHEMSCGVDGGVGTDDNDLNTSIADKKDNENFDEEEQQRLFRKAVDEFRSGKVKEEKEKGKKITVIREEDEEVDEVRKFILIKTKIE